MMGGDEELARLLEPLRAEVAEHHRHLVGAGVAPVLVAQALAGWGARGMADHGSPADAAARLRALAEAIEAGAEMTPGAAKPGAADSAPPRGADPRHAMARSVSEEAGRLARAGVDAEEVSIAALAAVVALMRATHGVAGTVARLEDVARRVRASEAHKRPTGRV